MSQATSNPKKLFSDMLIAFYLGEFPDIEGRMIETIWAWDYRRLEYTHNYIQWLFPMKQRSHFNSRAPILDDETIELFKNHPQLKAHLLQSFKVMLKFYGLQCSQEGDSKVEITKSEEYLERKQNWLNQGNHNYLRITRILTSLSLLGLGNYAQAFFKCLDQIYQEERPQIGRETYEFWKNAGESTA
jgi:hypothetical protein